MFEIPFIDLKSQKERLGSKIEKAIHRVLEHGIYIMGPEIAELEQKLAESCNVKHAITCSSGTDALVMFLMAENIGPGDAVLVPSFTFASTAEVVVWLKATPIFVDVLPDTYNMDPKSLEQGLKLATSLGLSAKGVITVDLFGQPADYDAIEPICEKNGIWLFSDAAQSFGAVYKGRKVGSIGKASATSFYPAKPLGCYGDGGAIFTNDDTLASIMRSIRVHGQGSDKYDNVRIGINGRMDTIQAAILLEKLHIFEEEILERQKVAAFYNQALSDLVQTPILLKDTTSSWAQYTIRLGSHDRKEVMQFLTQKGVPTAIHYPKALHQQTAYKMYPKAGGLEVSEFLAKDVLSLPMHSYLNSTMQKHIVEILKATLKIPETSN
jgi:dTDP-4-amino-4,6-dideoxygalactose transaminase